MKKLFIFALLTFATALPAQQLTQETTFWGTYYRLGETTKSRKDVQLHLDRHKPEAGDLFYKATNRAKYANGCAVIGAVGTLAALFSRQPATGLAWAGVGVVGWSATVGFTVAGNRSRSKALRIYNGQ